MKLHFLPIILLLFLSAEARKRERSIYLQFANEDKGALTPISELFFDDDHSDGHLTQALYLSYCWSLKENMKMELSLEQDVFTPEDKRAESSEPGDRPFAGYLGTGGDLIFRGNARSLNSRVRFDLIQRGSFDLALTGPPSGAARIQNWAHRKKGVTEYSGWEDQVAFRLGVTGTYRITPRFQLSLSSLDLELSPHGVVSLSNVVGYQGAGITLRFGKELAADYGPPLFSPVSSGNETLTDAESFAWNLFFGIEGRHVFNNYLLEGTTDRTDRQTVSHKKFVADTQTGMILQIAPVSLAVSIVNRTKEFHGQAHNQQFLRLGLAVSF